jgi:hypothetical protein
LSAPTTKAIASASAVQRVLSPPASFVVLGIEAAIALCVRCTTNRAAPNPCDGCDLHVLAAGLLLSLRVVAMEPR